MTEFIEPQVGQSWKIFFNKDNPNNKLIHIRGIVDDEIVFRSWSTRKQYWFYYVESILFFLHYQKAGYMTLKNRSKS